MNKYTSLGHEAATMEYATAPGVVTCSRRNNDETSQMAQGAGGRENTERKRLKASTKFAAQKQSR